MLGIALLRESVVTQLEVRGGTLTNSIFAYKK